MTSANNNGTSEVSPVRETLKVVGETLAGRKPVLISFRSLKAAIHVHCSNVHSFAADVSTELNFASLHLAVESVIEASGEVGHETRGACVTQLIG